MLKGSMRGLGKKAFEDSFRNGIRPIAAVFLKPRPRNLAPQPAPPFFRHPASLASRPSPRPKFQSIRLTIKLDQLKKKKTSTTKKKKKQKYNGDKAAHTAHPARFSPDDKFSRQRIECKRRFGLLPTQQPPPAL